MNESYVISLGGSLIARKDGINTDFLKKFKKFILKQISLGRRFFIIVGGGATCRLYRDAAQEVGILAPEDLDWLGIHSTRLNAHLIRTIFRDWAHSVIINNPYEDMGKIEKPIVIAAGWKPGWSTDYDAVVLAQKYKTKTVINMSNIDMVYDKDPAKYKDAVPIEKTSWEYFRSLVGDRWDPGLNVPFDPVASKLAQKLGLTVIILRGDDLNNLEKAFVGKKFVGTVIAPLEIDASFYDREYFEGGKIGEYKGYTTNLAALTLRILRDTFRALKIKIFLQPKSLLDVGCGTGEMVKILRLLGIDGQGLEISKYLLSRANPNTRKFLKHGSVLALPYQDSSFEVVTTFDVLEHIPTEDLKTAVAECNRVAQKFVLHKIFTSENWWIKRFHGLDISHISVFGKSWWEKFWQENGISQAKRFYPRLPVFMETLFLLEKKK